MKRLAGRLGMQEGEAGEGKTLPHQETVQSLQHQDVLWGS